MEKAAIPISQVRRWLLKRQTFPVKVSQLFKVLQFEPRAPSKSLMSDSISYCPTERVPAVRPTSDDSSVLANEAPCAVFEHGTEVSTGGKCVSPMYAANKSTSEYRLHWDCSLLFTSCDFLPCFGLNTRGFPRSIQWVDLDSLCPDWVHNWLWFASQAVQITGTAWIVQIFIWKLYDTTSCVRGWMLT